MNKPTLNNNDNDNHNKIELLEQPDLNQPIESIFSEIEYVASFCSCMVDRIGSISTVTAVE